jgi:MoxR-like ATPase
MAIGNYTKLFDPKPTQKVRDAGGGDRRSGEGYVFSDEIILAVNVAIASKRPLLVRGPSGTGKSSLAYAVARELGWRTPREKVVTSRTQARDFLWEIDLVRRLNDATSQKRDVDTDLTRYIMPGILWWAFDEQSYRQQEARALGSDSKPAAVAPSQAVVLIDEIDKADPDTPNDLLVPLGSMRFSVDGRSEPITVDPAFAPLVVITTNDERDMPAAFLRRCVELTLELPPRARLVEIGTKQCPSVEAAVVQRIADAFVDGNGIAKHSPAEFVDALWAFRSLKPDATTLNAVLDIVASKPRGRVTTL